MNAPLVFENAGRIFRPDTCEPLKAAIRRREIDFAGWARANYPGTKIPDGVVTGLLSIGVWDAHSGQCWSLGEHCNEGLEVTFVSRGRLSFAAAGERYMLESGHVTVTRPWQVHEVGIPTVEASRLVWLIVDVGVRRPNQVWRWPDWVLLSNDERARLARIIHSSDQTVWNGAHLGGIFDQIVSMLQTGDPGTSETDAKILLNTALMRLLRTLSADHVPEMPPRDSARQTVRIFLNRLGEHLAYPWRIEEMARQCGVTRTAFIDHCHAILNTTPHAYLVGLRLTHARRLLRGDPKRTLTDIALECGFGSSSHFSATFRKDAGLSPSQYRAGAAPTPAARRPQQWPEQAALS